MTVLKPIRDDGSIQWADPPPRAGTGNDNADLIAFAEALRAEPGRWAVYPRDVTVGSAQNLVSNIRQGKVVAFGAGFDATQRAGVLYVRYVGAP